jgi:membrane protein DedA with SNARE-associated domain
MKRINIITVALLVYLAVMAYIGYPGHNQNLDYTEYFLIIGFTIVIIFVLRYLRIRIYKSKEKNKTHRP